jgi:tetratricopeptide (TPR) repeat protein
MKNRLILALLASLPAIAGTSRPAAGDAGSRLSPAEKSIALALQAISKHPGQAEPYNSLAFALARRARETADSTHYAQAEEAVKKSLALAPGNLGGEKARIWILLGKHEFAQALESARALNRRVPDDVMVYGFLTDAHVELGNYEEAEKAADWMLRLRPGNIPGLTRAAYLRELFGDIEGALELMTMALHSTPFREFEERAWIMTQMAHLHLVSGRVEEAELAARQALELFSEYHYALAALAEVRTTQKKYAEAADLLRRRYRSAPHPENLYALAAALERAGHKAEARVAFARFENEARGEMNNADNANRELSMYYAGPGGKPREALRVAGLELARRRDVYTREAYAWALFESGRWQEARSEYEEVLALGIRNPKLLERAAAACLSH